MSEPNGLALPGTTRVRVFYPADPAGIVPGGVDTFLRGVLKWAPQDLDFSLVGMTTEPATRPLWRWTRCELGRRDFAFHPVVHVADAGGRSRVPLSVRYCAGLLRAGAGLRRDFDVMEFHRIEPALLFGGDDRPKNAVFHQDMAVIRSAQADILWRRMPGLYFGIEKRVVRQLASAWCVRQEGVEAMRGRFPEKADVIRFVPTWVDTEVFTPPTSDERVALRARFAAEQGLDCGSGWIISVGRLDSQKNPRLLLDAVARLHAQGRSVQWLVVGDGVLRADMERAAAEAGVAGRLKFLGLLPPARIAQWLRAADVFALSSAYEGMPMALLEALGSGLPVVTTDVGEVKRVVEPGGNGEIVAVHEAVAFADALARVLDGAATLRGEPAVRAIRPYQPAAVLEPVYENYRRLAAGARRAQQR
jgi:glycosyltransferase involved in cell wall biosynthesis